MSPGRRRSHAESESERDFVLRAMVDHRHGIRSFLALFAAKRAQIDAAESALWKAWLARPSDASATGIRAGLQRLAADAIARQLDASAASALAGQDPLVHLLSQSGREALQRPSGDDGVAHQVQSRLAALDPELQELLRGRYRERQSNVFQAARLGWPSARVDARLHWARNALDWTAPLSTTEVADAAEGLLPTLIEDYLAGTIDVDSRALLVKRAMDDMQVATRVERQVRLDLILGELLTQFTPADQTAFAECLAAEPEAEPIQRSPGSNPRRSASLPAARPASRPQAPVSMAVIGAVVLGCVVAGVLLLIMARPSVPSTTAHPTAVRATASQERPTSVATPTSSAPSTVATAPRPTPSALPTSTVTVSSPKQPEKPISHETKTYVADFSAGVAKDWTPVSGAWSVVGGNYIHTSADGIHLSRYEGATWGDLAYSASLFPRFDNAYGLVFGFQDVQTYDVLTIVNDMATLQRVTNGVTTQVAQAACQATSKWKWSTAIVTRVGRKVSVSINQTPVFTDIDLGAAAVGKIGLYTAYCQADFGMISVTPPRR